LEGLSVRRFDDTEEITDVEKQEIEKEDLDAGKDVVSIKVVRG